MQRETRILLWMCVLVGVNQLGFGSVVPSLALYAQSFGVSASAIGLTVGIYGLARFALATPAGTLSDRLGRRPTLALGALVSAVGNLWCAAATGFPEFVAARFVAGAGAGMILTGGQIVLADITTPERRGRVIAIYQGAFIFSVGIGPLPGGLLAKHYGLAAPFVACGIASALACAVAWFGVSETRPARASGGGAASRPSFLSQIRLLRHQIGYVLVCLVALMNAVARTGGLFSIVPVLGTARLGLSVDQIGFGLAFGTVVGLLAAYPAGMLVDYFGRKAVIVPSTVASGASMLLFGAAPSYAWFVGACVIWGLASSIGSAAPASYAADSAPPGMNAATMSTFRMVGDFGYVAGPIALGLVVDAWSPDAALGVAAALLVGIGILFAWLAPETYRGKRPS